MNQNFTLFLLCFVHFLELWYTATLRLLLVDLSGVMSKDGETRNEVDLMLSMLGTNTSQPNSTGDDTHTETARTSGPCSTTQQTSLQTDGQLQPSSTSENICKQELTADCTSQGACLVVDSVSACVTESQVSTVSEVPGNDGSVPDVKSDPLSASVGGSRSVLETSDVSCRNRNVSAPLPTSSSSGHLDPDRSIMMTSVLFTSTPLEMDESTVSRTVPSSSACIVNMETQFAAGQPSLAHSEFSRFIQKQTFAD